MVASIICIILWLLTGILSIDLGYHHIKLNSKIKGWLWIGLGLFELIFFVIVRIIKLF